MELFSRIQSSIGKITFTVGSIAWIVNSCCYYLFGTNNLKYTSVICISLSTVYMIVSLLFSVYCIQKTERAYMMLSFLYWAAILLLTLPIVLELTGILPASNQSNSWYFFMMLIVNAPLFGFNAIVPQIVLPFLIIFYSGLQLSMLTWGICNMLP